MKNPKPNSNLFDSNKRKVKFSSKKQLKTIEECPETEDIIKKINAIDFSTEKSFETPFITLTKTINKVNNLNKSISVPNLFNENFEEIPSDMKSLKGEEINDSNYLEVISKFFNIKDKKEEKNTNNINKLLIKEKSNRILMLLQKCNLNKICLDKMNKFICSFNNLNTNLYQPLDIILDIVLELIVKIQEEYSIKNELINKLNNISLNKESYEKQIYEIKNELQNKEEQLEKLMNKETLENIDVNNKKENNQQELLFLINNMKKENQFLFEKVLGYKTQVKKLLSGLKILYEKHKISLEEISKLKSKKTKDLSIVTEYNFEINGINKNRNSSSYTNIRINTENNITTKMIRQISNLANNLIKLLYDINTMLFKCDFNLIRISKNYKIPLNDINEITPIVDINFLLQEKNFVLFSKCISCNLDIINNKIINLASIISSNNLKLKKDNKTSSVSIKNSNEIPKNSSISRISRINTSIKFFSPENKNGTKTMKNYINLKKTRNNIRNQKLMRNSTSRDGLSFMNYYNHNNDLDNILMIKKNSTNKVINQTVNLEKQKNKK